MRGRELFCDPPVGGSDMWPAPRAAGRVTVSGARRLSTLACEVGLGAPLVLAGRWRALGERCGHVLILSFPTSHW